LFSDLFIRAGPATPTRGENVDTLKTFADAFVHRRGILMVATFNEGEEIGKRTKQWTITPNDRLPIAIGVICEQWTNGTDVLDTFVMLTSHPICSSLVSQIGCRRSCRATRGRRGWAKLMRPWPK
jgi:putative SOS response-associated peptidase YedK